MFFFPFQIQENVTSLQLGILHVVTYILIKLLLITVLIP